MGALRFFHLAEADVLSIVSYTLSTWGEVQTVRYLDELEACCQEPADHPELGRLCDDIRPGLYRKEHGKHVIFFRRSPHGILVYRILHGHMLPGRHSLGDEK